MTLVNIDLRNQGYETGPDDRVIFYSLLVREGDFGTISTAPVEVRLTDGKATIDLAPGPVGVQIIAGQVVDTRVKIGEVPPSGPTTLGAVMMVTPAYTPALQKMMIAAVERAKEIALTEVDSEVAKAVSGEVGEFKTKAEQALTKSTAAESKSDAALSKSTTAESSAGNAVSRVEALEALGGLSPESPVDGQTANLLLQPESLSRAALDQSYTTKQKAPLMLLDYATGDGIANDTAGVQQAFNDAISQGRALYSPQGSNYLVDPLAIAGNLTLEGSFLFTARTDGQECIIRQTARVDWSRARVTLNGLYRSRYGLIASAIGRSGYGHLELNRNRIWGFKILASGNNNLCTVQSLSAQLNGSRDRLRVTQTSRSSDVTSSLAGFGDGSLDTSLSSAHLENRASYYVLVGTNDSGKYFDIAGEATQWSALPTSAPDGTQWLVRDEGAVYTRINGSWPAKGSGENFNYLALRIRSLAADSISVFNMGQEVGASFSVWLPTGGGVDWESHGDNGVWVVSASDIRSNYGIGIHHSALYGHTMSNMVLQGNTIGFACSGYTMQMTFDKPYFEVNYIDYVSQLYVRGVMQAPLMDTARIQNVSDRFVGGGKGNYDSGLVILTHHQARVQTTSEDNPGARSLQPGRIYAHRYPAGVSSINVKINNSLLWDSLNARTVMFHVSRPPGTGMSLTFTLEASNGETIEGTTSHQVKISGPAVFEISKVGNHWRVIVLRDSSPVNSISAVPSFLGQTAVVGGVAYIAVGTASTADWKQITA